MSKNNWEYRIYENEQHFDNLWWSYHDEGFNKREAIKCAKERIAETYPHINPIVKIQRADREEIEIYTTYRRDGKIIFKRNRND